MRQGGRSYAALRHVTRRQSWHDAVHVDLNKAGVAAPLRVGAAVTLVFVVSGLTGHHTLAGFGALGALVAAFCRPDPYPVRVGRLMVLGVAMPVSVGIGAVLGVVGGPELVGIAVISLLAGAAAYLVWSLHIVGPGAVVFMFAAVGAESFAREARDVIWAVAMTSGGAVVGVLASLAPWLLRGLRSAVTGRSVAAEQKSSSVRRESIRRTLARAPHRVLVARAARITVAGALAAGIAVTAGFSHPMWAAMGAVAAMQGIGYHVAVHRGVQRLVGNVGGAVLAAGLLALPLDYWGAVAAIIVLQTVAEIMSTVNYALCSLAVTPMALLMTSLGSGLSPAVAVDRVLDTGIGIVTGLIIAALTISGADVERLYSQA
ncbi:FUSC family protein [Mycolicibacterium komossense]|uniref:FUSC family protein n=1 Tax=Mycolicibacterium komossense TaxID=1779 RepID=A0ABT3C555_9MYCO|nr:FUSC family protein [Mycolicibacterium komossense]